MKRLSKDALRHIAEAAGLNLNDNRLEKVGLQFEEVLNGVLKLDEIEIGNTEPADIHPREEE